MGFRSVEVTKFEAIAGARRFTEEGVRWRHVTATGTIAGDPADSVTGEDFTVYRRKEEFNFTP